MAEGSSSEPPSIAPALEADLPSGSREPFYLHYLGPLFAFVGAIAGDLRFYEYSLLRVEVLALVATIACLAVVPAWLGWRFRFLKVPICFFLVLVVVDAQSNLGNVWTLLAAAAGVFLLVLLLRDKCAQLSAFGFGVLAVSNLLLPVGSVPSYAMAPAGAYAEEGASQTTNLATRAGGLASSQPPPLLHLILDEHIGYLGLAEVPFAEAQAPRKYLDGLANEGQFTLYKRGFSQYRDTYLSLAAAFNYSFDALRDEHYSRVAGEPILLKTNRYFDDLASRGYQVQVIQSDYLNFCAHSSVISCATYQSNTPAVFQESALATSTRAIRLFGHWVTNRLEIFRIGSELYDRKLAPLGFPIGDVNLSRVGPMAAVQAFAVVTEQAPKLAPGEALVAHLFSPHYPYVFNERCELIPGINTWLTRSTRLAAPKNNTQSSRQERYQRYLEQMQCVHSRLETILASVPESTIVYLHGDHGSRISLLPPQPEFAEKLQRADLVDNFSTLMLSRIPGTSSGSSDRWLALSDFLKAGGQLQQPQTNASQPMVMLVGDDTRLPHPLDVNSDSSSGMVINALTD